jgi:hypothetical protein
VPSDKLRLMNRTSLVRRKDQTSGLAFGWLGPCLQFAKKSQYPILEIYHAPATLPFRVFEAPSSFPPFEGFRNAYRAAPEIEIRPGERQIAWAVLAKGERYHPPILAEAVGA